MGSVTVAESRSRRMFLNAPAKLFVLTEASPPVSSASSCSDSVLFEIAAEVTAYGMGLSRSASEFSLAAPRPPA